MVDTIKQPRPVGAFIRQRREALGLSQRALGQLFDPPVTTQFISNVERGVTPLPPTHVPTLTKSLLVSEQELMALLEKEYTMKLTGRLGHGPDGAEAPAAMTDVLPHLVITPNDYEFMRALYDAIRQADPKTRQAFFTVCESLLSLTMRPKSDGNGQPPQTE